MDYQDLYSADDSGNLSTGSKCSSETDSASCIEVDTPQCRICYEGEHESGEALISPCNCTGSVHYVHASCLNRWRALNIDNRNRTVCNLCKTSYRVHKDSCFDILFSAKSQSDLRNLFTKQRIYNGVIKGASMLSLAPLAIGASVMFRITRRHKDAHLGQSEPLWDEETFNVIFGSQIIAEINRIILSRNKQIITDDLTWRASLIYGFSKLGYYGCTWWLFTDGLSDAFPRELNRSPFFVFVKAALEFLIIPHCLNIPRTSARLVPFIVSNLIGILFVLKKIESRLRKATIGLMPDFEEYELGRFVDN